MLFPRNNVLLFYVHHRNRVFEPTLSYGSHLKTKLRETQEEGEKKEKFIFTERWKGVTEWFSFSSF